MKCALFWLLLLLGLACLGTGGVLAYLEWTTVDSLTLVNGEQDLQSVRVGEEKRLAIVIENKSSTECIVMGVHDEPC